MRSGAMASRLVGSLAVLAMTCALLVIVESPAFAYTGSGAASYADQWALARNSNYPSFSEDCTNYISQALHDPLGGQKPYVNTGGGGGATDYNSWWVTYSSITGFNNSQTWSVANTQYTFMNSHGGAYAGSAGPSRSEQETAYTPGSVVTGDLLYYDWDSNGRIDHVGIQVGIGTDPDPKSKIYGNYSDQHTNDHYHAFWSLLPYNSQWPTTTITFDHVSR